MPWVNKLYRREDGSGYYPTFRSGEINLREDWDILRNVTLVGGPYPNIKSILFRRGCNNQVEWNLENSNGTRSFNGGIDELLTPGFYDKELCFPGVRAEISQVDRKLGDEAFSIEDFVLSNLRIIPRDISTVDLNQEYERFRRDDQKEKAEEIRRRIVKGCRGDPVTETTGTICYVQAVQNLRQDKNGKFSIIGFQPYPYIDGKIKIPLYEFQESKIEGLEGLAGISVFAKDVFLKRYYPKLSDCEGSLPDKYPAQGIFEDHFHDDVCRKATEIEHSKNVKIRAVLLGPVRIVKGKFIDLGFTFGFSPNGQAYLGASYLV